MSTAPHKAPKRAPKDEGLKDAFVLRDCAFGIAGTVVTLPLEDAEIGALHGMLDLNPAAIDAVTNAA